MKPIQVHDDIIPIGEFKTHAARIMRQLRDTGRPIVITQHGKPAGVLVPTADFDRLTERARFVEAVERGLAESEAGLGISDDDLDALSAPEPLPPPPPQRPSVEAAIAAGRDFRKGRSVTAAEIREWTEEGRD